MPLTISLLVLQQVVSVHLYQLQHFPIQLVLAEILIFYHQRHKLKLSSLHCSFHELRQQHSIKPLLSSQRKTSLSPNFPSLRRISPKSFPIFYRLPNSNTYNLLYRIAHPDVRIGDCQFWDLSIRFVEVQVN